MHVGEYTFIRVLSDSGWVLEICLLSVHTIVYTCEHPDRIRRCIGYHRNGAEVLVDCRHSFYETTQYLSPVTYISGKWNLSTKCTPVCGIYKEKSKTYIRGGRNVKKGELTSHVGIYSKLYTPYMQICSGTIIRADLVLTERNWLWVNNLLAAHCFWKDMEGLQPASQFAVAAGKIYRPWSDSNDDVAQKSEIADIKVPPRYRGGQTNFQDDIALLLLATPFEFSTYVWPACVDFDVDFDRRQLRDGNLGKIAGWGLTAVNGRESPILQVVELPYVDVGRCIDEVPPDFRRYVTSDKICAGYANGTALCRGDSGGGLMFSKQWQYWKRYYIRGVASTAPQNDDLCNAYAMTTFTQILAHEHFIRDYFDADPLGL